MQLAVEVLNNGTSNGQQRLDALEALSYLVEPIDNANGDHLSYNMSIDAAGVRRKSTTTCSVIQQTWIVPCRHQLRNLRLDLPNNMPVDAPPVCICGSEITNFNIATVTVSAV